jgi:stress-induced morphogen
MENWVKEIELGLAGSRVIMEGQEGSCSRICKVISDQFIGLPLLKRHRLVKKILEKYFAEDLHALSLQTYTNEEFDNA